MCEEISQLGSPVITVNVQYIYYIDFFPPLLF